jgi:hypothetical protein
LKDFHQVNEALDSLKTQPSDSGFPIIPFIEANLFFEERKLIQAEKLIIKELLTDPKHTLAKRLKQRIEDKTKN